MTILERLLRHDAWTTRSLLELSGELPDADLDREFDIGHRSLRRTFVHIIANMECWCDLMSGLPQRSGARAAKTANSIPSLTGRLDIVGGQLLALGKSVEDEGRKRIFLSTISTILLAESRWARALSTSPHTACITALNAYTSCDCWV
jgi:uncharacterized damage-inducible protein DinB